MSIEHWHLFVGMLWSIGFLALRRNSTKIELDLGKNNATNVI